MCGKYSLIYKVLQIFSLLCYARKLLPLSALKVVRSGGRSYLDSGPNHVNMSSSGPDHQLSAPYHTELSVRWKLRKNKKTKKPDEIQPVDTDRKKIF